MGPRYGFLGELKPNLLDISSIPDFLGGAGTASSPLQCGPFVRAGKLPESRELIMTTFTRRGFVASSMGSVAMVPLLLATSSAQTVGTVNPDPYSYVDPELAAALRKFPAGPGI